jgi:hypothetical protein
MNQIIAPEGLEIFPFNGLTGFDKFLWQGSDWLEVSNQRRGGWSGAATVGWDRADGAEWPGFREKPENQRCHGWRHPIAGELTLPRELLIGICHVDATRFRGNCFYVGFISSGFLPAGARDKGLSRLGFQLSGGLLEQAAEQLLTEHWPFRKLTHWRKRCLLKEPFRTKNHLAAIGLDKRPDCGQTDSASGPQPESEAPVCPYQHCTARHE